MKCRRGSTPSRQSEGSWGVPGPSKGVLTSWARHRAPCFSLPPSPPGGPQGGDPGAAERRLPLEGAPLQPGGRAGCGDTHQVRAVPGPERAVARTERPCHAAQLPQPVRTPPPMYPQGGGSGV